MESAPGLDLPSSEPIRDAAVNVLAAIPEQPVVNQQVDGQLEVLIAERDSYRQRYEEELHKRITAEFLLSQERTQHQSEVDGLKLAEETLVWSMDII